MDDNQIRAQNLWSSAARKHSALDKATELDADPKVGPDMIGGLEEAQEEVLTYACAITSPEIYARWGTHPPSGLLLLGRQGVGKALLARALATRAETPFLRVRVPQLVLDIVHSGTKAGELIQAWTDVLEDMPNITVYFDELEFSQAQEIGVRRTDLPIGPIMDFMLDFVDRAIAAKQVLVVGATSHPDTLRPAFFSGGRFERVVEVNPRYPDDIIEALGIHAHASEERAGRPLFADVDWGQVVRRFRGPSTGEWIQLMHGVLRRKARSESADEQVTPIMTEDLLDEVDRFRKANNRLPQTRSGNYV
jgi:ATP-dependent 26S proteasome regulatory subunit